jgi:putative flippase GtrA
MPVSDRIDVQFLRYAVVGLSSNGLLFLCYLGLTALGMGHKTAMTLLYVAGVLQTFIFNKRWSFRHGGEATPALMRYLAAYAAGYVINYGALLVLVDRWGLPHQWVQFFMIGFLAVMLFVLQRYWVFRSPDAHTV